MLIDREKFGLVLLDNCGGVFCLKGYLLEIYKLKLWNVINLILRVL